MKTLIFIFETVFVLIIVRKGVARDMSKTKVYTFLHSLNA